MKIVIILFAAWLLNVSSVLAQELADAKYREHVINRISTMLNQDYVFPVVALKAEEHLREKRKQGAFDSSTDVKIFAENLTKELQQVTGDKHLRVLNREAMRPPGPMNNDQLINLFVQEAKGSGKQEGFAEAKVIEGNIGYIDFRHFAPLETGAPIADAMMKLVEKTDAIIIDLRNNGGGNPEMVSYLCSYFFEKPVHLNSLYHRRSNDTTHYWSHDKPKGLRRGDVPLFILTSNYTFSGAEEFSYNMKTQKRGVIIGETTGGGANPGGIRRVNEQLVIFIPDGTAINPVTGTNWEGTGVKPDVEVPSEVALEKGITLASEAAENYRRTRSEAHKKYLSELFVKLENLQSEASEAKSEELLSYIRAGIAQRLLKENEINMIGYHLLEKKSLVSAELVLKSNTILFPDSPNAYDSYGDALVANNKAGPALKAYQRAVELAEKKGDKNLSLYRENLNRHEKSMAGNSRK